MILAEQPCARGYWRIVTAVGNGRKKQVIEQLKLYRSRLTEADPLRDRMLVEIDRMSRAVYVGKA
jgi:hypothetical protein